MNPLISEHVLLGLLATAVTLVTALLTFILTRRRDDNSNEIAKMQTTLVAVELLISEKGKEIERLRSKIDRQEGRIDSLESENSQMSKGLRRTLEKYSVSSTYILSIWTLWYELKPRLDQAGISYIPMPPIPTPLRSDLMELNPELLSSPDVVWDEDTKGQYPGPSF